MTTRIIQGQVVVLDYIFKISKLEHDTPFTYSPIPFFGGQKLIPEKKHIKCVFKIYCIDKSEHLIRYNYDEIVGIEQPISAYLIKLKEYSDGGVSSNDLIEHLTLQISDIENHILNFGNSKIKEITDILTNIKPIKIL
jgi:hypothetical protein